jgi:beta-ureidopropionase / N-carbamoyl-L-amino-acid hydrolase
MFECSKERMKEKSRILLNLEQPEMEILHYIPCLLKRVRQKKRLLKRMKAIGAEIETDDLANVYATLPGSDPEAKRIVMGSHVDSVKNGGNYDSVLGVLTAMEVLETFAEHGIGHRYPLTAMIWKNEEGSLYMPAMMVSGIIAVNSMKKK